MDNAPWFYTADAKPPRITNIKMCILCSARDNYGSFTHLKFNEKYDIVDIAQYFTTQPMEHHPRFLRSSVFSFKLPLADHKQCIAKIFFRIVNQNFPLEKFNVLMNTFLMGLNQFVCSV